MLNYETYCKIRDHLGRQSLTAAQTAQALGLDVRTVTKWAELKHFQPRASTTPRVGKLDAFKGPDRAASRRELAPAATHECVLELENARGAKMRVQVKVRQSFTQCSRRYWDVQGVIYPEFRRS